ncbi:epidermal growth factor receptor kinase substrate 8-like protein 1a isoform X2 [Gadus macrocephalus]|uniref:epidermal growth factor receptor kinase substrate 8-like protein 1a isoform X2 n=1 Tax=Gadus macrocephalus TaxID=80720 RepID=UPI0028CB810E|nr:epidermal growth factor receptor kinase substrate 8-like protein 1a isoform X2 [Gadus macrocephalus]
MSTKSPPLVAGKPSGVRVMITRGEQPPADSLPMGSMAYSQVDSGTLEPQSSSVNPQREVEMLNHCFDDLERFMGRLQQTADAQGILNQRRKSKKRSRKSKKEDKDENVLTMKACPPIEEEFVGIFQKIKYSFSLLDRLKPFITEPNSPGLLHHVFVPLDLLVKTTGGPELGASVVSPALTSGAVSLLQKHLTQEEKDLWNTLGPNWTSPCSQLGVSVPPYTPVFLDGWEPGHPDSQPWDDPVEVQHREDSSVTRAVEEPSLQTSERPSSGPQQSDELDGSTLPPEGERMFNCSYDFVARNSSELSVLQGETLEVVESSKRWWKCRNRFDQIGFVPFNILEPMSALSDHPENNQVARSLSKKVPLSPPTNKYLSYAPPSLSSNSPSPRPRSALEPPNAMPGDDAGRGFMMNNELLQRLTTGRAGSVHPLVIPRTTDTSAPLDYHSSTQEVEQWLSAKGFSPDAVSWRAVGCSALLTEQGGAADRLAPGGLQGVQPDHGAEGLARGRA